MMYLIDGSGPDGWDEYVLSQTSPASVSGAPSRGFAMQLAVESGGFYRRGPTKSGKETWQLGDEVFAQIRIDLHSNPRQKVILAGHSRGGAACLYVARRLRRVGVPVDGLLLFDAVRRTPSPPANVRPRSTAVEKNAYLPYGGATAISAGAAELARDASMYVAIAKEAYLEKEEVIDVIPSNVRDALHLVRDEQFSFYFQKTEEWTELERAWKRYRPGAQPVSLQRRRRELERMHAALRSACRFNCIEHGVRIGFSFGNTGLTAEAGCRFRPIERFHATHGAMGGAPLDPMKYIPDSRYASEIAAIERSSMLAVRNRADSFLSEIRGSA